MAGQPIRRARREWAEHQRQVALRGGEEPMHPNDLGYQAIVGGEPVTHPPIPPQERPPRPRVQRKPREPKPAVKVPALTEEEATVFAEARKIASKKVLDFLKFDLTTVADEGLRHKMLLKQLELSQGIMSLTGRIDPAAMRGQQTDEVAEILARIKGTA